ncbi:GcrA family cell cycle regulator [Hyphomicrobium sp.]|uniref:GcrA family cell cycle regulator n=1 Tax=Hyphomicrobium sp. TaxID=82 RepID=UPI001DCD1B2A|nr:GcrA family cell cycle regulator [Hyphomicrobium sp.]MBY0561458.1 GcrA family cell cycle regulator [Hyphomicrobium sp.]
MAQKPPQPKATYASVNPPWSERDEQHLIAGWNKGKNSTQLGFELNRSASAIVGKVIRLRKSGVNLVDHERPLITPNSPRPASARREKNSPEPQSSSQALVTPRCTPSPIARKHLQVRRKKCTTGVWPEDLADHHCRWPKGDPQDKEFHHCGKQRAPGISYCPSHAKLAFPQLTSSQMSAMTTIADAMEAARKKGQPQPFRNPVAALKDCQESLKRKELSTS